jgi:hypothetical protein
MSNPNAKNIAVKGYMAVDNFVDTTAVLTSVGMSMSTAICLGLKHVTSAIRQLEPAHRTRRKGRAHMPKTGLKVPLRLPRSVPGRRGAPTPHTRV